MNDDIKVISGILTSAATAGTSSIAVATITSPAPGILGAIGLTTTTTVALPVAGVLAVAGLVGFGLYKGIQAAHSK